MREMMQMAAAIVVIALGTSTRADASFFVDTGTASTPSAGLTTFTYNLSFNPNDFGLNNSSQLTSGNYVTLYDFSPSLLATSTVVVPAGITSSIALLGFTAPGFPGGAPPDSASINNITFTYTGTTLLAATSFQVSITLPGSFTLGTVFGSYGGIATYQQTAVVSRVGQYFIPVSSSVAVPEPTSLVLCGIAGLGGLVIRASRKRLAS